MKQVTDQEIFYAFPKDTWLEDVGPCEYGADVGLPVLVALPLRQN